MTTKMAAVAKNDAMSRYSEAEWKIRLDLAACYRLADHFGFSDLVWNHITARVPGTKEQFLINRFGLRFDEVTASNLVKIDANGQVVDGPEDVNVTGYIIHSAIYAQRNDVACIMHSHPPGGLAVSALKRGLLPLTQDGLMFYNRVAYHDYEGLSTDPAERQRLAANLGEKDVMILRNHGLLTVGRSVGQAFISMYYLEKTCRTQMQVLASGEAFVVPPPEVCEHAARQYAEFAPGRYEWPALLRLMDERNPSYRA